MKLFRSLKELWNKVSSSKLGQFLFFVAVLFLGYETKETISEFDEVSIEEKSIKLKKNKSKDE